MDAMDKDHLIDRIAGELAAVLDASGPIGAERIVAFVIDRLDATWECEVCGDERPDDLIAVAKASLMTRNSSVIGRNMKYCMDRKACRDGAMKHVNEFVHDWFRRVEG